ncbi:hypothetical protein IW261DRAFT_1601190 [Armillaria novae-zelandiae]|uniref:Uncharacterized protein n=1 Tax=Armillaria novae-zelandiae TaxID=153914 RepID=A0AA39PV45_9AGAR|nr:hypothetical protein IW261DRAFT_1601190 [Armillaria novae-zelandiae]
MAMSIYIETLPLSYARMLTRLAKKREEQAGQSQRVPQTPQKAASRDKARAEVQSTQYSHESTSYLVAELQTQDGQIHNMDEADSYLKDDLRYQIFIEFETFLVNFIHLPDNWRVALESDIAAVQNDAKFRTSLTDYLRLCDEVGTGIDKERELYRPHAELCRHVIDVLQSQHTSEVPEGDQIRFHRVDPYVVRGSMAMLKPDIVGVMDKLLPVVVAKPNPKDDKSKGSKDPRRHIPGWPQVLELKEMKGTDEGSNAIRLKTKGKIIFAEADTARIILTYLRDP